MSVHGVLHLARTRDGTGPFAFIPSENDWRRSPKHEMARSERTPQTKAGRPLADSPSCSGPRAENSRCSD